MQDSNKIGYEAPDPERPSAETPSLPLLEAQAERHDPYLALRYRDYRFYSIGWLFASVGFQMQLTAIGWEIFKWTNSALMMGLAGGIQAVPLILLALPSGHIADRYNRRTIAVLGQFTATICSLALALLSLSFARGQIGPAAA